MLTHLTDFFHFTFLMLAVHIHRQTVIWDSYNYLDERKCNILHKMMRKCNWKNWRKNGNPIFLSLVLSIQFIPVHCGEMKYFQVTLYLEIESYFNFLPLEFLLYLKFLLKWYVKNTNSIFMICFNQWNIIKCQMLNIDKNLNKKDTILNKHLDKHIENAYQIQYSS